MHNLIPDQISYSAILSFPVGFTDQKIGIHTHKGKLVRVDYLPEAFPNKQSCDTISQLIAGQLADYFSKVRIEFSVPLLIQGTDFQQKVWRALRSIPAGQTCSYSEIATQLNSSARAVGNACRANAIPIIIPCHRVVAKSGVGGYCGQTGGERLKIKQWLLRHERS